MESKKPKNTNDEFYKRTRERMAVYIAHPPNKRAAECRKLGKSK